MANNLHISYDLNNPGQNYEAVIQAIKTLGSWAKIHKSYWYADSQYSSAQAVEIVRKVMDQNDQLYIVDATNNTAHWYNLPDEQAKFIQGQWPL